MKEVAIISYFPAAYPDELLYSLLARYHLHSCSTSPKQTLDDLYGDRNVRATMDLPGHLGALCRRLPPDRGFTPEQLAAGFTLLPYYAAFERPLIVAQTLAAMIEGHADGIHLRLGMTASTVTAPDRLRFCPACHAEALARYGERYWRRAHQLPGVLVCPDHGVPLADSTVSIGRQHQHAFTPADERNCGDDHPTPAWATNESCWAILLDIAQRSTALLSRQVEGAEPSALSAGYRTALTDRRLASAHGRVDQRRLHDAFLVALAPALTALSLPDDWSWLAGIVRKQRHAFHPLHRVLFGLFLDRVPPTAPIRRPSPRRVVATSAFETQLRQLVEQGASLRRTAHALEVDPNTVRHHAHRLGLGTMWKPLIAKPPIIHDDPGPAIRARWLRLQQDEPSISLTALTHRLPAEHSWLYRHDRNWLAAHSPPATLHPLSPARRRSETLAALQPRFQSHRDGLLQDQGAPQESRSKDAPRTVGSHPRCHRQRDTKR
ncbi:hypothetical protein [Azospirillum palustre]